MSDDGPDISIIIEYRVDPEILPRFLELLKTNSRDTSGDDGCLRMEISQPAGGPPGTVFLTERWRDQAAIEAHRRKPGHDRQHAEIDAMVREKRVVKGYVVPLD